ncbi:MAG: hypothetical protein M3Q07_09780 [Pseudobdellovibrionaceae bacterium]|nr:hypothetical protein [Pseudobdellovibrionaceae bacterium]
MRQTCLLVCAATLLSCKPGDKFEPFNPSKGKSSNATAQPLGSDAIPVPAEEEAMIPPDDPLEEEKAIEPAIIGGAYLYCDSDESKPGANPPPPMTVGCRVGNIPETDWMNADKNLVVMNTLDNSVALSNVTIAASGSPYHFVFSSDRSLQNNLELQMDVTLPQGRVTMSTTVNPGSIKAIEQRLGPGLALYASTGAAGDWSGMDRKTWNLWMPLKIPKYITNFNPGGSGPGSGETDKALGSVELSYDDTVCTYRIRATVSKTNEIKGAKPEDYIFESCTRNWLPDQWVRSKALSLRIMGDVKSRVMSAGVILQSEP